MAKTPLEIRSLARKHTEAAIKVLVNVAASSKAPANARVAAASALLDRGWGKPKQELEHGVNNQLAELLKEIDGRSRGIPG